MVTGRMKMTRSIIFVASVSGLIALSGCGGVTPSTAQTDPTNSQLYYGSSGNFARHGSVVGDDSLFSFGRGNKDQDSGGGAGLGVNVYLWRGALETLSFMPLASADPFGGVIITDWYQPPSGQAERFKATAYILGRQLRADGVRVQIFRQVQQGGQWVDAPVSATTSADIENKVLARARELRTLTAGS